MRLRVSADYSRAANEKLPHEWWLRATRSGNSKGNLAAQIARVEVARLIHTDRYPYALGFPSRLCKIHPITNKIRITEMVSA
jgi:hypothetical protein